MVCSGWVDKQTGTSQPLRWANITNRISKAVCWIIILISVCSDIDTHMPSLFTRVFKSSGQIWVKFSICHGFQFRAVKWAFDSYALSWAIVLLPVSPNFDVIFCCILLFYYICIYVPFANISYSLIMLYPSRFMFVFSLLSSNSFTFFSYL